MNFIDADKAASNSWDVIVVGSGMGSLFFLEKYLEERPDDRVLIVEKGGYNSHDWQLRHLQNSDIDNHGTYRNIGEFDKEWAYTIVVGADPAAASRRFPHPFDDGHRRRLADQL